MTKYQKYVRKEMHFNRGCGRSVRGYLQRKKVGLYGDYSILSFNGNKMITGSTGGMLFVRTDDEKSR